MTRICLFFICCIALISSGVSYAKANENYAIILAYFQVGDQLDPEFSLSKELFEGHIQHLREGSYNIIGIDDFLGGNASSAKLGHTNVVLTFENASLSTLENIAPILKEAGFPYTLFVTPQNFIGDGAQQILASIAEDPAVTIGFHPNEYKYYDDVDAFEASVNRAKSEVRDIIGENPEYFAFPYSLYTKEQMSIINRHDFNAILGQHSGAAMAKDDILARFTMTENYASLERFQRILNVTPLVTKDEEPSETVISGDVLNIGFTLDDGDNPEGLSCFLSGKGRVPLEVIGGKRIEIRPELDPEHVRYRLNCILHEGEEGEIVKWKGFLFEVLSPISSSQERNTDEAIPQDELPEPLG